MGKKKRSKAIYRRPSTSIPASGSKVGGKKQQQQPEE